MTELQALKNMLTGTDAAMAAVVFVFVSFLVKPLLPSPLPEIPGAVPNRWKVVKDYQWVPLAMAFLMGTVLAVLLDPDVNELYVSKIRGGLATGAYSVAMWESYSVIVKPIIDKVLGK
jgi:hypothetical protein